MYMYIYIYTFEYACLYIHAQGKTNKKNILQNDRPSPANYQNEEQSSRFLCGRSWLPVDILSV